MKAVMMKSFLRLLFSLVTTPRLQLKFTLLSISKAEWFCIYVVFVPENTFFPAYFRDYRFS